MCKILWEHRGRRYQILIFSGTPLPKITKTESKEMIADDWWIRQRGFPNGRTACAKERRKMVHSSDCMSLSVAEV